MGSFPMGSRKLVLEGTATLLGAKSPVWVDQVRVSKDSARSGREFFSQSAGKMARTKASVTSVATRKKRSKLGGGGGGGNRVKTQPTPEWQKPVTQFFQPSTSKEGPTGEDEESPSGESEGSPTGGSGDSPVGEVEISPDAESDGSPADSPGCSRNRRPSRAGKNNVIDDDSDDD
ncbi:unnamed protein product [Darwinula stevensoni]|uniref:PCNA-associated factor histone-like domain-containing protein n=1 Tax=Darwinula stevensoni TaxID=69355 RepID=A0A7R8XCE4_9CRUS|nr:unnamed protein product [Darwinula stevensoni]CAG0887670.1 unnamed protein product [Darwinula stevensoni]